jgi:hypothetical protein
VNVSKAKIATAAILPGSVGVYHHSTNPLVVVEIMVAGSVFEEGRRSDDSRE